MTGTARKSDKASSKTVGVKATPTHKRKPSLAKAKNPFAKKKQAIKITSVDSEEEIEVFVVSPEKKNIFSVAPPKQTPQVTSSSTKKSAISGWIANFKSQPVVPTQVLQSSAAPSPSPSSSVSSSRSPSKLKPKSKASTTEAKGNSMKKTSKTEMKSSKKQKLKPQIKASPLLQHFKKQCTKT
eukprot:m.148344 g.148344  ORF g.148344 m.148344 type:complete len:183 (+) comp30585_c1_seq1:228-776(+)